MTAGTALVSLSLVRRLPAPVALVFAACSQPQWLVRWLAPGAGTVRSATIDFRPQGRFQLDGTDPDGESYQVGGRYLEILAPRRIASTWRYRGAASGLRGPDSKVVIDLRVLGSDACEVTLTHSELADEEVAALQRTVWIICLDRLAWCLDSSAETSGFRWKLGAAVDLYGDIHRQLQDARDSRRLANKLRQTTVTSTLTEEQQQFIAERDMVFLATVDHRGFPTCSYKGGAPGFARVRDQQTLTLPLYNGNGMYLSAGNAAAHRKVGLLFIDFEVPHRLRIHGSAELVRDAASLEEYPGAEMVIVVTVYEAFVNCPRYIHRYRREATSDFVPGQARGAEIAPWKRLDLVRDLLPADERSQIAQSGTPALTSDAYRALRRRGKT